MRARYGVPFMNKTLLFCVGYYSAVYEHTDPKIAISVDHCIHMYVNEILDIINYYETLDTRSGDFIVLWQTAMGLLFFNQRGYLKVTEIKIIPSAGYNYMYVQLCVYWMIGDGW